MPGGSTAKKQPLARATSADKVTPRVFQRVIRWGMPEGMISYRHDDGAWLNAAEDHAPGSGYAGPFAGLDVEMTPCMALEDVWI